MNTQEAMESKMTAGSETETAGVMGKSKETAGSEAEMVVGTESGVDTEVGMDSESTADRSRAVVGTATGDDAAAVTKVQVGPIAEMIPSVWAANVRLRIGGMEMERVG